MMMSMQPKTLLDLFYLCYFVIISTCLTCMKTLNHLETKLVGVVFKLRKKMKNLTIVCSRSPQTLNLVPKCVMHVQSQSFAFFHFIDPFLICLSSFIKLFVIHFHWQCYKMSQPTPFATSRSDL